VPFLDQDLVKFAQNLPNVLRVNFEDQTRHVNENNLQSIPKQNSSGKKILRRYAEKKGNPLTALPKKGFSGPDASWFKTQSRDFITTRIMNPKSNIWDFLDYKIGHELISAHLDGVSNRRLLVWSLLSLESTFRQFL